MDDVFQAFAAVGFLMGVLSDVMGWGLRHVLLGVKALGSGMRW